VTEPQDTQAERTALAWQRTALGVVGVAALLGHRAISGGHPALLLPAGACALLGVALLTGIGAMRDRQVHAAVAQDEPLSIGPLVLVATAVVVVVAVAAAVSIVAGRLD
jgi:putative membrane protein